MTIANLDIIYTQECKLTYKLKLKKYKYAIKVLEIMLASLTMYTEHELDGILKVQKKTVNVFVH